MGRLGGESVDGNHRVTIYPISKKGGAIRPTFHQGGRGYMSTHIIYLNYIKTSHEKETIYPIFILYRSTIWSNLRTRSGYIIHEQRIYISFLD